MKRSHIRLFLSIPAVFFLVLACTVPISGPATEKTAPVSVPMVVSLPAADMAARARGITGDRNVHYVMVAAYVELGQDPAGQCGLHPGADGKWHGSLSIAPGTYTFVALAFDVEIQPLYEGWTDATISTENTPPVVIGVATLPAAPAALTIVTADTTDTSIHMTWTAVGDAVGYKVYRSDSELGPFENIGGTESGSETSFVDNDLASGTTYWYRVSSVGDPENPMWIDTNEGPKCAAVSGTTTGGAPLGTPTGLSVDNPTASSLDLSWDLVDGAIGYKVYRSDDGGQTYPLLNGEVLENAFQDTGLDSGTSYLYEVSAYKWGRR